MKKESTADKLLNDLLENGGVEAGESLSEASAQLAVLAGNDPALAKKIREELEFSEMIRQILLEEEKVEDLHILAAIESEQYSSAELLDRVRNGEATEHECNLAVRYLWDNPEESEQLSRDLAEDELFYQVLSPSKSEASFVEALETRMWAEARGDHFVKDFESRLDADNVLAFPASGSWKKPLLQLGALAAVVAVGAFVAVTQFTGGSGGGNGKAPVVAEVLKTSGNVVWKNNSDPMQNGDVKVGSYELASGVVSLRFSNGQEMTVEGPAQFDVTSASSAFVHSGIALAKSPGNDLGFTLKSNGVSFSRSTKLIGIDARAENSTNVLVFGGDVGVCLENGRKCREIYEAEALKADNGRDKLVDIPYQPQVFSKTWELISGVEKNMGQVRIEAPGSKIQPSKGAQSGTVQVFVENESFHSDKGIDVDQVAPGHFASIEKNNPGQALQAKGKLRSYLLQLWPGATVQTTGEGNEVEASLTFDHPIVGLIFTSDRLAASDALVGTSISHIGVEDLTKNRGLDSGSDSIVLSEDRRTISLSLKGGLKELDHVRVLVALN